GNMPLQVRQGAGYKRRSNFQDSGFNLDALARHNGKEDAVPKRIAARGLGLALCVGVFVGLVAVPSPAQDTKEAEKAKTEAAAAVETPQEKKERAGRRACAARLCAVLHNRKPAEGQVACNIQKTWRKAALSKILSRGKVSWPWGTMRCAANVKVDRALLVKAMAEAQFEAKFDTYDIRCEIDKGEDKYKVSLQVRPEVTFKQGKAIEVSMNWGKIEAPTLAKTALWSITAADTTFGLLQRQAVEDINKFITDKCMEVKEAWQGN